MNKLEAMSTFVRVVERGSFSAVARELQSSQPNISKLIRALELSLGGRLFARSTRRLSLTDEGQRYYAECRQILAAVDAAEHSFKSGQEEIAGPLCVGASVSFGRTWLAPRLRAFLEQHRGIQIHLQLNDKNEDLLGEGIDVAFRFGALHDSSLVARRVGDMPRALYASPAYVAQHGAPRTPAELTAHNCLVFTLLPTRNAWTFAQPQGKQRKGQRGNERGSTTVAVQGNATSNSSEAIREMVLAGMGISLSPAWQFADDLAQGRVVQLLPDYVAPALAIHAVFSGHRQSARVAAFVDYIIASMPPAS